METIIFLLNHMLTYCINVDLGKIVFRVRIEHLFNTKSLLKRTCIGKINRNYPVTREVTGQGVQLVISVVAHFAKLCVNVVIYSLTIRYRYVTDTHHKEVLYS